MKKELVVIVFGIMFLILGQSTSATVTSWSQVAPISGTEESPNVYRSGQVTDIDVSVPGGPTALTTAWGGYFLGALFAFTPHSDGIPTGKMRSIARYPANGDIAVVATGSTPSNGPDDWGLGLYYTSNGGMTWQLALQAGPYIGAWRFEKVRWGAGGRVFAVSNRGVWRSTAYGAPGTWEAVYTTSSYQTSSDILDIAVDPASRHKVYIVTGDGRLLRSTLNGNEGSWRSMALPVTKRDGSIFDRTHGWSSETLRAS